VLFLSCIVNHCYACAVLPFGKTVLNERLSRNVGFEVRASFQTDKRRGLKSMVISSLRRPLSAGWLEPHGRRSACWKQNRLSSGRIQAATTNAMRQPVGRHLELTQRRRKFDGGATRGSLTHFQRMALKERPS
jgi:hypothetical protein